MHGLRPRALALAVAIAAVGTLTLLPDNLDAASSCLPGTLKARLSQINKQFGRVSILSTYRRGARMPNGRASFHASCQAVDFKPSRGTYARVASWLKSNHSGGVGTYSCGMHHIHIDTGPRVRFHRCQRAMVIEEMDGEALRSANVEWASKPGERAWPLVLPAKPGDARL